MDYTNEAVLIAEDLIGEHVKLVTSDGEEVFGYVRYTESAFDNKDDDTGLEEATVAIQTDDGDFLGFFESQIKSVERA